MKRLLIAALGALALIPIQAHASGPSLNLTATVSGQAPNCVYSITISVSGWDGTTEYGVEGYANTGGSPGFGTHETLVIDNNPNDPTYGAYLPLSETNPANIWSQTTAAPSTWAYEFSLWLHYGTAWNQTEYVVWDNNGDTPYSYSGSCTPAPTPTPVPATPTPTPAPTQGVTQQGTTTTTTTNSQPPAGNAGAGSATQSGTAVIGSQSVSVTPSPTPTSVGSSTAVTGPATSPTPAPALTSTQPVKANGQKQPSSPLPILFGVLVAVAAVSSGFGAWLKTAKHRPA